MNNEQVATYSAILSVLATIFLVYFFHLVQTDKKLWTIVNFQLFFMITGYIGYVYSYGFAYHLTLNSDFLDAKDPVKRAYTLSFLFVAIAQCSYLNHSWLRAKTILFYKNRIWYLIFDAILKITNIIIFTPVLFQSLSFILHNNTYRTLAVLNVQVVGLTIFVFDCFIIYSFINFFASYKGSRKDMKHEQIAKHGIIASIAVLITVIYNGVSIVLEDKNVGLSNVFTIATSAAFQVPIWSFVLLKRALKVDGATGSKASNQAEGDQVPSGPEGV